MLGDLGKDKERSHWRNFKPTGNDNKWKCWNRSSWVSQKKISLSKTRQAMLCSDWWFSLSFDCEWPDKMGIYDCKFSKTFVSKCQLAKINIDKQIFLNSQRKMQYSESHRRLSIWQITIDANVLLKVRLSKMKPTNHCQLIRVLVLHHPGFKTCFQLWWLVQLETWLRNLPTTTGTPSSSPHKRPGQFPTTPNDARNGPVPNLLEWFLNLAENPERNGAKAMDYLAALERQDINDLKDLTDFNANELVSLTGMTIGLAKRILRYAEEDLPQVKRRKTWERQNIDNFITMTSDTESHY